MTAEACRQWHGPLGSRALGVPDPEHEVGLDAHLEGCSECRAELEDLTAVAAAVSLADPDRVGESPAAPPLADRILEQVGLEADQARRRRRRQVLVSVAAVIAVIAMLAASLLTIVQDDPVERATEIHLLGAPGVEGSAELIPRAWGTEVTLEVSGLERGEVYWLWLSDESGDRSVAGTFSGTGRPAEVDLASALPLSETHRIWMTDEDDEVVLDAFLD